MAPKLPPSSKSTFALIHEIISLGTIDIPPQFNGTGAPGETLQYLLNVKQNNYDSPDFRDWEIKFHGGKSYLTLLHKDPEPKNIIGFMIDKFGWNGKDGQINFRHTVRNKVTKRGFSVSVTTARIGIKHIDYTGMLPYWKHNTIFNAFGAKLRRLIVVNGKSDLKNKKVTYQSALAYWDLKMTEIPSFFEQGILYLDFDARTKDGRGSTSRDHGTKIRVGIKNVGLLYENQQILV